MLHDRLDNTGLLYATMLKRPFSDKLIHESCSDQRCLALQTSDENYETKHVDGCSNCPEMDIDQRNICDILRKDSIPVIYVQTTEDWEFSRMGIVDLNANSLEYIAISHVWAHGLGNPKKCSLPLCQVMRLHSLVVRLQDQTSGQSQQPAFWIDTLCVPVDPKFKDFRKLAISRLDDTFRQARQVLVLDADLQRCSMLSSRMELATRVVCSGWMRRLWTLSEAVVAEETANAAKVDVQFVEGSIELNAIAGKNIISNFHTERALICIFSGFPQFLSKGEAYAFLASALRHRSTSRLEDEPICLASILGFKPREIDSIVGAGTAEERTHLMYTFMDQIPASIVFSPFKKLKNGFRWAPATLIGVTQRMTFTDKTAGKCDVQGLHVQYSGYVMTRSGPSSRQSNLPIKGSRYLCDPNEAEPFLWIGATYDYYSSPQQIWEEDIKVHKFFNETPQHGLILNPQNGDQSALVSVTREEKGIIYATFERIGFARKPQINHKWGIHDYWKDYLINARKVPSTQKWCIN